MPLPALPAELTDAIIDHLHADRLTLATCSLVCRAWRGAAQHHLLATIYLGVAFERLVQLEAQDGSFRTEDDSINRDNLETRFVVSEGISASFATASNIYFLQAWRAGPAALCMPAERGRR